MERILRLALAQVAPSAKREDNVLRQRYGYYGCSPLFDFHGTFRGKQRMTHILEGPGYSERNFCLERDGDLQVLASVRLASGRPSAMTGTSAKRCGR